MRGTQAWRWTRRWSWSISLLVLLLLNCSWGHNRFSSVHAHGSQDVMTGQLPGALPFDSELVASLETAWVARDADYTPRTRHLNDDKTPKYTNRLYLETSPYLRQHAHNPMNWFPWGDEAFDQARKLGRPVLLSIGYSTCHWCHVMEEESFEDEEIAQYMNEHYIAIKVDREERPDIDAVYMSVVQMLTGRGGWPMTVWLTPDREAFSGATYIPARDGDRGARIGFLTMLKQLKAAYDSQPDRIIAASAEITKRVSERLTPPPGERGLADTSTIDAAVAAYGQGFDATYGGLQGVQKFPSSLSIRLLLRHYRRTNDEQTLHMATHTLEKMASGGMYDHVGGGFHRYATDPQWLVPHFEKMLYDNALLVTAYLEAYQATGRENFKAVAQDILRYVERDMSSPQGGFYSATDADSLGPSGDREEGWFFTWTPDELSSALPKEQAQLVSAYYNVTVAGNFEGRNILNTPRPLLEVAEELNIPLEHAESLLNTARETLYKTRTSRPAPLRDNKVLTSWNGLMISAFAQASLILDRPDYAERATAAANFLLTHSRVDGQLRRTHANGQARINAYLDDYAFLITGLLDLYEATSEPRWLENAFALDRVLESHFEDEDGGFFMTSDDHETLLAREKPNFDGAEPSGNSVQLLNLMRLHEFTTDDRYRQRAERSLRAFDGTLSRTPVALAEMLLAVDFHSDVPKEIIIITPQSRDEAAPFLMKLRKTFLPNRVLSVVAEGDTFNAHATLIPLVEGKFARDGQATAYVCENRICDLPTTDPEVFAQQIERKAEF